MTQFANKTDLTLAYAKTVPTLHPQFVQAAAVYVPHKYRGGWVIRGFGYSVERIGRYVSPEAAGNPLEA